MRHACRYCFWLLLSIFAVLCLIRSGVQAARIANEVGAPPVPFHPEITACMDAGGLTSEQQIVLNYRNVGEVCGGGR